ncbi:DUF3107 domain-containing protein [Promicromonospora thailandica]|uniref:DUF3107 family protein n=1 Tax=Promicromonospora thailandica TaxID=765201 RepID=A0A9X2JVY8_9MICO|nr:DUF3107 domain-containing protein [Promicromonospora thailandica]MCP2264977.1 Protein of unknown function (DUF3107) [Promicromonospora thailandica]BFF18742.1 DUF3107 domain-containing protein [Promicromonospora thailandica]
MDVTIGVQNLTREVTVETEQTAADVAAAVKKALAGGPLELTDSRGRQVIIPGSAIGYVEIGSEEQRKVGFGAV